MEVRADKIELVRNFIKLGMALEEACLAAGLTEEQEEFLMDDEQFMRLIKQTQAVAEFELLQRHDTSTKIAEKKGQGQGALQWRLEKLNPKRYSNKDTGEGSEINGRLTINVIRGKEK